MSTLVVFLHVWRFAVGKAAYFQHNKKGNLMKNKIKLLLALCGGLLIAGCSLFGSSSSSVSPVAQDYNLLGLNSTVQFAVPSALASSKPKTQGGVVSQSSNVGSDNTTQDLFKVAVSGNANSANWALHYDAMGNGTFTTLYAADGVTMRTPSQQYSEFDAWYRHHLHGVTIDMNGDGTNDGRLWARTHSHYSTVANTMVSDTDYLTSGWWLYAPLVSSTTNYAMGAFVSRPDSKVFNMANAAGEATYVSSWSALYMSRSSAETGEIQGRISLNANFDTDKISGYMPFFGRSPYESDGNSYYYAGTVMLNETDIMSDSSFSGSGSGQLKEEVYIGNATVAIDRGTHNTSVNWGGKFFGSSGEQPDEARGTFAGETGGSNGVAFIGNFGASKQ